MIFIIALIVIAVAILVFYKDDEIEHPAELPVFVPQRLTPELMALDAKLAHYSFRRGENTKQIVNVCYSNYMPEFGDPGHDRTMNLDKDLLTIEPEKLDEYLDRKRNTMKQRAKRFRKAHGIKLENPETVKAYARVLTRDGVKSVH